MQFPTIDFGWLGNGNLIGMVSVLHVIINHAVAIGGSVLMVSIEYAAYKSGNARLDAYAKWLCKWILIITTTLGAMTGVGIWFATTVVLPNAIGALLRIFHWAWFTEWIVFVTEVLLLLTYYYTWDSWKGTQKKKHVRTGIYLCVASWFTLAIITGVLAAQINPGDWVETLSFWSAFANETWVPSILFRTFAAITLGVALLTPITKWYLKDKGDEHRVLKIYGKWLIASVPCMLIFGWWYLRTLPDQAQTLVKWATGMSDSVFIGVNVLGLLLILVLGMMLLDGSVRRHAFLTVFTMLFSLLLITEFEIIRENIRKPYVIYNYMYANGVVKSDVPLLNEKGALPQAKFSSVKQVTEENKLQAGEELFRMQCIACHTIDGPRRSRAMAKRVEGWTEEGIASFIPQMHNVRNVMPPFVGTEEEVKALAAYIHQIVNERSGAQ
ncbi:c-type cytochrome [Paenibacillus sp. y28]|uniref:c-type cytochrome n=1 Tax=Paenibacillus sp. y28 TaxID=3129110 RepID=UPI0030193AF4